MSPCSKCGRGGVLVVPLHGERGGPSWCLDCGMAWHAEHTRRRKAGRLVSKAISLYLREGGTGSAVSKLARYAGLDSGLSFIARELSGIEPDTIGAELGDFSTELVDDILQLVHPDKHPEERRALAHRVTQAVLALRPFTFPAPVPKPEAPPETPVTDPVRESWRGLKDALEEHRTKEPYPCEACLGHTPYFYCRACRAIWDERQAAKHAEENAKQRRRYQRRKELRSWEQAERVCAVCGAAMAAGRKDRRTCSATCRQRAQRARRHATAAVALDSSRGVTRRAAADPRGRASRLDYAPAGS